MVDVDGSGTRSPDGGASETAARRTASTSADGGACACDDGFHDAEGACAPDWAEVATYTLPIPAQFSPVVGVLGAASTCRT